MSKLTWLYLKDIIMPSLFITKYIPATNTRGSRIRVSDGEHTKLYPVDNRLSGANLHWDCMMQFKHEFYPNTTIKTPTPLAHTHDNKGYACILCFNTIKG